MVAASSWLLANHKVWFGWGWCSFWCALYKLVCPSLVTKTFYVGLEDELYPINSLPKSRTALTWGNRDLPLYGHRFAHHILLPELSIKRSHVFCILQCKSQHSYCYLDFRSFWYPFGSQILLDYLLLSLGTILPSSVLQWHCTPP